MAKRIGESGGGWSDGGAQGPPAGEHPFRVEADGRYRELEPVGRGGMGTVVVAYDHRLGRDVALKRIAAATDDPRLAARLAREARITAVLEHPSIIPVYDAGVGADGRLYYTMRLVHGRSLAEAAAACVGPHERLRLIRPFLAACEAMAYAHSLGVVHRDLKPANIMVGGFGETQVVDWGLAAITARAPQALRDEASEDDEPEAGVGTPGYMSPEQARGRAADPRADVWSLGAILRDLLPWPPPPPELAAIVAKATAAAPADRYPDAGAMAADVDRFLDGRRVEAHTYSTAELARRLLWRLRIPLALAATTLVVIAIAVAVSFGRIERSRRHALAAEANAQQTAARALTGQAMASLEDGAIAEAGALASRALELAESADARGVVAAALATPHPDRAETIELAGCTDVVPGSWELALCREPDAIALWRLDPAARQWRARVRVSQVALAEPAGAPARVVAIEAGAARLLVLDAATGATLVRAPIVVGTGVTDRLEVSHDGTLVATSDGKVVNVFELRHDRATSARPCDAPGSSVISLGPATAGFAVICRDGATRFYEAASGWRAGPALPDDGTAQAYAVTTSLDGAHLLVGTLDGKLREVAVAGGSPAPPIDLRSSALVRVAYLPGTRRRALVATDRAGAALVDLETGAIVLRLPADSSRRVRVTERGVVAGGQRAGRWHLPDRLRPRALRAPAGLAAVATTADRRWIAAARGDNAVSVWDGTTGALAFELQGTAGHATKAVAFSPDGDRLAISARPHGVGPDVREVGTWTQVPFAASPTAIRRLAYTADGALVAARFASGAARWSAGGELTAFDGPEVIDLATTPDRAQAVALAADGTVFLLRPGGAMRPALRAPGAGAVTAWSGGDAIATAQLGVIDLHVGGRPARRIEVGVRALDLAVSPDERYLLAGLLDGTVGVWRLEDLQRVATLRGHDQRVAHLTFSADGMALGAGWDGQVLSWDLRALAAPPSALVAELEARWGLAPSTSRSSP